MAAVIREKYETFFNTVRQYVPNVDPLLAAKIAHHEKSDADIKVEATITYRSGTALQKGIAESDRINSELRKLGIDVDGGDSKTNEKKVTFYLNLVDLDTLVRLSKDSRIERIELK